MLFNEQQELLRPFRFHLVGAAAPLLLPSRSHSICVLLMWQTEPYVAHKAEPNKGDATKAVIAAEKAATE